MKRLLRAVVALLLLSGCRAPAPPNDPFLYRSTVPPPGTITPSVSPGQPYYPAAPTVVPGPTTIPPMVSPGTPVSPSPAPLAPSGMPALPAAPPNKYAPPSGFNYQSSLRSPAGAAQPIPVPTNPMGGVPADPGVVAAGNWQTSKGSRADDSVTRAEAVQPRPEPSVVRIVEAAGGSVARGPADAIASTAIAGNASATPSVPSGAAKDSAMPATISTATVTSGTLLQTVERPGVPEITDLPPAGAAAANSKPSAADQSPVNIPADRPGASYGYDPDYKTLRGKLEYSVASRRWKLAYLPPDGPIDEYGGNIVLPDPGQLDGFEAGDFVTVQGAFSPPTAGGGSGMFAIQRIKRQ